MEPRPEQIVELREKFFKKLEDNGPPDPRGFYPADIARIKKTDDWLKRFLEHNDNNVQESLDMLWESCTWRRTFGVNDITEQTVRRDYLQDGSFFSHGKDKNGKALFIVKSKLHTKGSKDFVELQKCIVYWFERLEREGGGNQITLFFDMADAGLSNLDMEFTKYLIGLFKTYYPNFLNYIIIFEMAWVLNAAFKIIKSLLPAKAIPKIKLVNKASLKEFVDPSNALECWGGTDTYTFTFVPEAQSNMDSAMNGKIESHKKIHFAEGSPMTEQSPGGFGDQSSDEEQLLSIKSDTITFNKQGNETVGTIILKNVTSGKPLSYKIKTTSPEKFRVRPSSGVLSPSDECTITVVLQPGFNLQKSLRNDRFLVMCFPLKNASVTSEELAVLWKCGESAESHRLTCTLGESENDEMLRGHSILSSGDPGNDRAFNMLFSKITSVEENYKKLHKEVTSLKYFLLYNVIVLTILTGIVLIYIMKNDTTDSSDQENCHISDEL